MAFDFSVSVFNSNLFRVASLLRCRCCWRSSTSFCDSFWGFWFVFLRFCPWWVVESSGEISFSFRGLFFLFLLYGPQVDHFFFSLFLFACRMTRGHEEVSTSPARCIRGTPRETPTASSLVDVMSAEELRLYSQIHT